MYCRILMMSAMESGDDCFKDKSYAISDHGQSISTDNKLEAFIFDKIFSEQADQKMIWKETHDVIGRTICDGLNAAILAYGQIASGKTFTIQGTEKQPGIILRAITYIEELIIQYKGDLTVTCWMAEIYMQEVRDLFRKPVDSDEPMWINDNGTIQGITLISVRDAKKLRKAFEFGIKNR